MLSVHERIARMLNLEWCSLGLHANPEIIAARTKQIETIANELCQIFLEEFATFNQVDVSKFMVIVWAPAEEEEKENEDAK